MISRYDVGDYYHTLNRNMYGNKYYWEKMKEVYSSKVSNDTK